MRPPLKQESGDPGMRMTMRRLLRELTEAGLGVNRDGRYRPADDLDPELAGALQYLTLLRD
jgi:hypothetical protein